MFSVQIVAYPWGNTLHADLRTSGDIYEWAEKVLPELLIRAPRNNGTISSWQIRINEYELTDFTKES